MCLFMYQLKFANYDKYSLTYLLNNLQIITQ